MTELARLGLRVESDQVATANTRLDGFTASSGRAGRATDVLNASLQRQQAMMQLVSRAAGFIGLAATVNALRTATLEYSSSLREVSTLIDTTKVSMNELSAASSEQAGTFNSSALTQSQALYQIISAGASTAAQATDTLTAANMLAVGGVTTVTVAADGLTSVLNAYGDKVEGATAVSDAMFVAMRAGKTTIAELSASLGTVAPLAAQTGVSFDELTAATAALTKGGISTNVAITGLRAILAAVAKPSEEAKKLAKDLGLEFNATALESKGLAGFMQDLAAKTGGNTDALALLFGGVEALVPVMALSGQAGEDFTAILGQMENKLGATDEAFGKVASGPAFQMGRIFSTLAANAIGAGNALADKLTPALTVLADMMTGAHQSSFALDLALKALAVTAGVTATVAIYRMVAAMVAGGISAITGTAAFRAYALSVALVGPAAATAAVATTTLGAAIQFALGPIGWAIAAVSALAAAWTYFSRESRKADEEMAKTIQRAGAGGARYLELRDAALAAAEANGKVGDKSSGAVAGMTQAMAAAEALKAKMTALGIETEWAANRLALLNLRQAQTRLNESLNSAVHISPGVMGASSERRVREATAALNAETVTATQAAADLQAALARRTAGAGGGADGARDAAAARAAAAAARIGAGSDSKTGRTSEERENERRLKDAQKFAEALKEETAQIGLNAIQRKAVSVEMAAALAPTEALARAIRTEGAAWAERTEAFTRSEAARAIADSSGGVRDQIAMIEREGELLGASNVERARQLAMFQTEIDLRKQARDIFQSTGVKVNLVDSPEGQRAIGLSGDRAAASEGAKARTDAHNLSLSYQLDLLRQIDDHARAAASGLSEAFGAPGRALGDLMTSMTGFQAQLAAINEAQRAYTDKGGNDAQRLAMFERDRAQAQIQNYGDMASAAKGFFKEGSDGYRLLQAAEQAYRLVQFAMSVQAMVMNTQETGVSVGNSLARGAASAAAGAARIFEMLGPFAFPVVGAMLAVLASLGLRGGSSGGSGRSVSSSVETAQGNAAQAQATQSNASASLAQSIRVEIGVNDDRFNAYVDGRTGPAVAAGMQASVSASRQIIPAEQGRKSRMTVGAR